MAKQRKLKSKWYRPRSLAALQRYKNPIPMVGDPDWRRDHKTQWPDREIAVYAHMMKIKRGEIQP